MSLKQEGTTYHCNNININKETCHFILPQTFGVYIGKQASKTVFTHPTMSQIIFNFMQTTFLKAQKLHNLDLINWLYQSSKSCAVILETRMKYVHPRGLITLHYQSERRCFGPPRNLSMNFTFYYILLARRIISDKAINRGIVCCVLNDTPRNERHNQHQQATHLYQPPSLGSIYPEYSSGP